MGKSEKTKSLKGPLKAYELDPDNARVHDEKNRKAVGQSLDDFGAGRSAVVDSTGRAIGGNCVISEWEKTGGEVIEVESDGTKLVIVKRTDLKPGDPERDGLALIDNQASLLGSWNFKVRDRVAALVGKEFDLNALGFSTLDLKPLRVMDNSEMEDTRQGRTAISHSLQVVSIGRLGAPLAIKDVEAMGEKVKELWGDDPGIALAAFTKWFLGVRIPKAAIKESLIVVAIEAAVEEEA